MKQSIQRTSFACVYDQRPNFSGSRSWYQMKGLTRKKTQVTYESPTIYQSKVMAKVKVFEKKVKLQGQRSEG
jgi:hypothetical protein